MSLVLDLADGVVGGATVGDAVAAASAILFPSAAGAAASFQWVFSLARRAKARLCFRTETANNARKGGYNTAAASELEATRRHQVAAVQRFQVPGLPEVQRQLLRGGGSLAGENHFFDQGLLLEHWVTYGLFKSCPLLVALVYIWGIPNHAFTRTMKVSNVTAVTRLTTVTFLCYLVTPVIFLRAKGHSD